MSFGVILIIVIAVIFVFLGSYLGLNQKTIWAFIGGYVLAELVQAFLSFPVGAFGMVSFFVGLVCAFFVQSRGSRGRY